ncbi:MAG TPA: hypothetical protein PLR99_12860 [Polyangiaceae bacterium]|nr:hypothetical protein [Polyangiaceae bacterium]
MNDAGNELLSRTSWLYTKLLEGPFFFFDLWSLAHLYSGFFVMLVVLALRARRPWAWLVAALVAYELLELAFIYVAFHAFRPETLKDQVTDVVVGALGGLVAARLARRSAALTRPARARVARHGAAFLAAVAIAFEWVGHYGYRYSRPFFNSPGLSWWAFLLWTLGLVAVAEGYAFFEARLGSRLKALAVTAAGYGAALGVVEYLGYAVLEIREVGHPGRAALALDLVHGTRALHAFYLGAPWLGVLAFVGLRRLLDGAASGAATRAAEEDGARGAEEDGAGRGPAVDDRQERPILTP